MPSLGLDVLDRTVQDTNRWLQQIMTALETDERQEAYHALRAVLFATRDRLPASVAAGLAAQLPLLVRGIFYEGYRPAEQPKSYRTLDEWTREIAAYHGEGPDAERVTRALFSVLHENIDEGAARKVFSALPEDVRALWPDLPEEAAHQ